MSTRRRLVPLGAGLLACGLLFLVYLAGAARREPSEGHDHTGPIDLTIAVDAAAGHREATIHCMGHVSGTGYLVPRGAAAACITALVSGPAVFYLQSVAEGKEPPCSMLIAAWKSQKTELVSSGRAVIGGVYESRPIRAEVKSAGSPCDVATWGILEPLFVPMSEPRVIHYDEYE